ncbi:MAG: YqhA family protein [Acidimicrobiales bacterium]|jgi:uncharacterized membrane protein YqhA|nr:YqhA family protein [Acidimicrobiales bacterium]
MADESPEHHELPSGAVPTPGSVTGVAAGVLERGRFLVIIGSFTTLVLAAATFVWAVVKAVGFVSAVVTAGGSADVDLVKLFEAIDTVLIGTVLLILGLGLWELFISDLDLPPSLTVHSFDDLKGRVATTLLLVLVVRFLEEVVSAPPSDELLQLGISVTLVGTLLMVFANWHR